MHLTHDRSAMCGYPSCKSWDPCSVPQMCSMSEAEAVVFYKSPSLWWTGNSLQSLNLGARVCLDLEYVKGLRDLTAYPQSLLEFYWFRASSTFPMHLVMQGVWGPWSLCSSWSLWRWNDSWPELTGWHNLQGEESEAENLLWKMVGSQT